MITGVALPILALVGLAIVLPRIVAPICAETTLGLFVNGLLSVLVLWATSAGYFLWAYISQDARLADAIGFAAARTLEHVTLLGLGASIIWGPVVVLAVASVPGRWKGNVW